jgi:CPA1 family monovalent cation:H+ antiporter
MVEILVLLGVAMASALLVQYLPVPYTVVLVAIGLIAGTAGIHPGIVLDRELLLDVFLPLLLFEAALHVDLAVLRDTWLPIALLAIPGVVLSTLVIAVPGSVSGATESLQAVEPLLEHALETLGGHTQHAESEPG